MSEFTEVFDDPLNPGKYISAEEQKRRDDALINDSTAKKTKKKKKKKGQITVSSILHNADKDEPETDSDEEDHAVVQWPSLVNLGEHSNHRERRELRERIVSSHVADECFPNEETTQELSKEHPAAKR